MSSNFLNTSGNFIGLDIHTFMQWQPVPPLFSIAQVFFPHIAWQSHQNGNASSVTTAVTTQCFPALQNDWSMQHCWHMFLPMAPPGPMELLLLPFIIYLGTSQPVLSVHSVDGQAKPLLAEWSGAEGLNYDCSNNGVGIGDDANENTVTTNPTFGDYAAAVVGFLAGSLYNRWSPNSDFEPYTIEKWTVGIPFKGGKIGPRAWPLALALSHTTAPADWIRNLQGMVQREGDTVAHNVANDPLLNGGG